MSIIVYGMIVSLRCEWSYFVGCVCAGVLMWWCCEWFELWLGLAHNFGYESTRTHNDSTQLNRRGIKIHTTTNKIDQRTTKRRGTLARSDSYTRSLNSTQLSSTPDISEPLQLVGFSSSPRPLCPSILRFSPSNLAMSGRGSFTSAGLSLLPPNASSSSSSVSIFPRRGSVFTSPPPATLSVQAYLQKQLFTKMHEEIYTVLAVIPKPPKPSLDVLAAFSGGSSSSSGAPSDRDQQSYYLVLTTNNQVKKSADGFGAPKLHWVKIKQAESQGGIAGFGNHGDVTYNWKKSKLLKLLKRIEMSGSNMTSGTNSGAGGATGSLRRNGDVSSGASSSTKEEFTLVFRSGDTDKFYPFTLASPSHQNRRAIGASTTSPTVATSTKSNLNSDRSVFVWYCLEICRSFCGFVPTSNIDTVLYQQLTNEITSYYLNESTTSAGNAPPPNVPNHLRQLLLSVSKNRSALADENVKLLEKSKVEEKVIVPSMTQEETVLVQRFLKQLEQTVQQHQSQSSRDSSPAFSPTSTLTTLMPGSSSPSLSPLTPPAVSSHSYLQDLESFLLHKLTVIEHANIQSLFDTNLEQENARILKNDIQRNLLDQKLDEMSLWINHHNLELSKMKKGVELIEKRNMSLDIQEKNQTRLYDTLHHILENFKFHPDPVVAYRMEQLLLHPNLSHQTHGVGSSNFDSTLEAVRRLDAILHIRLEDSALDDLQAMREQRNKLNGLKKSFTQYVEQMMEGLFQEVAKKAINDIQKHTGASASSADSLEFAINSGIHRELRKYNELLYYLQRLDYDLFHQLRAKYCQSMKSVYDVKIRQYFLTLKKSVAHESKDTRLQSFPDWTAEVARHAVRRTEGGRNHSTSTTAMYNSLLHSGPNSSALQSNQSGRTRVTQAFVHAMEQLTPSCVAEEKFLKEFFFKTTKDDPTSVAASSAGVGSRPRPSLTSNSQAGVDMGQSNTSSSHGHAGSSSSSFDDIHSMMVELFRPLEPELRDLASMASKMDHFYTLEMLVQCERILATSVNSPTNGAISQAQQCQHLESILTNLSTFLKLTFTTFIDGEIEWISSLHPSSKRCGVLQPMLKFPGFIDRMENIVLPISKEGGKVGAAISLPVGPNHSHGHGGAGVNKLTISTSSSPVASIVPGRSQAADTSYQKLASGLFRWLEHVAKSDDKYTDVVYLENMHFFLQLFRTPHLSVPALDQFLRKADILYAEHMSRYVNWNIDYEMPLITKFWNKLEEQLKSIQPEDIPFAAELSKHDLRAISKGPLASKNLQKSLTNVLKRIEKHLPKNVSRQHTNTYLRRFEMSVWQHSVRIVPAYSYTFPFSRFSFVGRFDSHSLESTLSNLSRQIIAL